MRTIITVCIAIAALIACGVPANAAVTDIRVTPKAIDFGIKKVGQTYFDGVKITNSSGRPLRLFVDGGLPDDFGFGLEPGSTCPVFTPGEVVGSGDSCRAVVRYTPSEFFAGRLQTGALIVTASEPDTGAVIAQLEVPVTGTGKLQPTPPAE